MNDISWPSYTTTSTSSYGFSWQCYGCKEWMYKRADDASTFDWPPHHANEYWHPGCWERHEAKRTLEAMG